MLSVLETSDVVAVDDVRQAEILTLPRRQLLSYREQLEADGWSPATMHRDFLLSRPADAVPSYGQCGVSSLWLIERLQEDHGIEAAYCYGDVVAADDGSDIVARHCWVEVGEPDDPARIVIDLTWDQVRDQDEDQIMRKPHAVLVSEHGVNYLGRHRMTPDQLRGDPSFWDRFELLRKSLS
jgi:hypothetical protein